MALKLKLLRVQAGLTLEQLAQSCGLTRSYISKVERGISTPSIETAFKLAHALGVNVDRLFGKPEQAEEISLIRARDAAPDERDEYLTLVAGANGDRLMRAFVIRPGKFNGGRARKRILSHHDGEEILYVLSGRLELTIGARKELLDVGDCVQFNSSSPHKLVSVGEDEGVALIVVSSHDLLAL
ncbi:transcriptional regulator [Bordetella genomosp. 10]|uniref:Transcriptional regulator n=1 Tax=Bordetella genomosp. 10 TaxID=1416804 RepID=A0A261RZA1_9BORD|nr:helix-turn-helix domain-containing protein [Bordetella genomosp. 10]OZI30077.1 transcriptional regulator [Bordetella genomosp. 10]